MAGEARGSVWGKDEARLATTSILMAATSDRLLHFCVPGINAAVDRIVSLCGPGRVFPLLSIDYSGPDSATIRWLKRLSSGQVTSALGESVLA